jgi:3-deoxy-7-phosphoheptulonate synthase
LSTLEYGVSITDPCIDWPTTESLLLKLHQSLQAVQR